MEQYFHLLIARPNDFIPSPTMVQAFLTGLANSGVVPESASVVLRTPSARTRQGINPFTGELVVVPMKDHRKNASTAQISEAVRDLSDYEIVVGGEGTPALPTIPINFEKAQFEPGQPYYLGVNCIVSSELLSTSSLYGDSGEVSSIVDYGKPCTAKASIGYFTNPRTFGTIQEPEAGCARFWIEFEHGKFLFPEIDNDCLDFLNPEIEQLAQRSFGISFVQGCMIY